jgi:hypothetical protein
MHLGYETESFISLLADALVVAGLDASVAKHQSRRALSEIEHTMENEETLKSMFVQMAGRFDWICKEIVGKRIDRMLIAPVPKYLEPFLPYLIEAIPRVVLADNFRVGQDIGGHRCVSLADALATQYDAYFLGTLATHLGAFFRDQFPPSRTIGMWELREHLHQTEASEDTTKVKKLLLQLGKAKAPIVYLTAHLDITMLPTLLALKKRGREVFVIVRPQLNGPVVELMGAPFVEDLSVLRLSFHEMLDFLAADFPAPVVVNYQRFFPSHWRMRNIVFLFAYSIAILRTIRSKNILQLYDVYNVCVHGFEWEAAAINLYRQLLLSADGILVNSETFGALEEFESLGQPVLSFFRYAPSVEPMPRIAESSINVVCITGFLGEHDDVTRATSSAIKSLLRQGFHVHYYSSSLNATEFSFAQSEEYKERFHLHEPIFDQAALVREISQYDVGWLCIDIRRVMGLEKYFSSEFGRKLASVFPGVTCPTAALFYGAAGLPVFATDGTYPLKLFGSRGALRVRLTTEGDIADQEQTFGQIDIFAAKREVMRERFMIDTHIERLDRWIEQFSQKN